MFEDQPANQANPPANLPADEPADMFAGIDEGGAETARPAVGEAISQDALSAGLLKKKTEDLPPAPAAEAPVEYEAKQPIIGKIILILVILAVLGGLGYGGWWYYRNYYAASPLAPALITTTTTPPATEPALAPQIILPAATGTLESAAKIQNDAILFGELSDADNDGIPDINERQIGTNPSARDTDADGLTDGEEVNVWRTNPLQSDTDADGYADGVEVKNGYDPLGPGKLSALPPGAATSTPPTSTK